MIKKSFDTPFPARKWGVSLLLAAAPLQQDMERCGQQQGNNENFEPTVRRKQSVSSIPVFNLTRTTQKMHFYGVRVKGLGELPIADFQLPIGRGGRPRPASSNRQSAIGNHRNSFDNPPFACNLSVVSQLNVNSQFWFSGYFYPKGNSAF